MKMMQRVSLALMIMAGYWTASAQGVGIFERLYEKAKNQNLVSYDEFFKITEFISVWEQPSKYVDSALYYLADPTVPEEGKHAADIAMQNLSAISLKEYIDYCRRALELRKKHLLSDAILFSILFENDRIANLEDKEIIELLSDVKSTGFLSEQVDYFLSGKGKSFSKGEFWPLRPGYGG